MRYVLEGSLRKSGNRIRVTAQLVEAETGRHVWAERYDRLEKAIAVAPGSLDMYVRRRVPWHRPEDHAHMVEGLRKPGWSG